MLSQIYARLRDGFRSGKSKNIEYRKYQLLQLGYMIQDNMKRFEEALAADLGRPPFESHLCAQISFVVTLHTLICLCYPPSLEIGASITEARTAWSGVDKWAKPERPPFSINATPMRPVVYKEPKGVVLIISPFNYPMWLCISPLVRLLNCLDALSVLNLGTPPFTRLVLSQLAMLWF